MKSVTKTYTSTSNSVLVSSGLTDAQMAGLYSMHVTSTTGADTTILGWYYTGDSGGTHVGRTNYFELYTAGNKKGQVELDDYNITVEVTFYYFA